MGYAVLGVVGGLSSLVFVKLLALHAAAAAKALPRWTYYVQPAMAGLVIGIIGLKFPQVMGAGYEYMDQAMHGQFLWQVLVALALLKVLATSLVAFERRAGRNVRADAFHRRDGGRGGGHRCSIDFFPGFTGPLGSPTRWWAWARFSPAFCARP